MWLFFSHFLFSILTCSLFSFVQKRKICIMHSWCTCSVVNSFCSISFFLLAIVLPVVITTTAITIIIIARVGIHLCDSLSVAAECFSGALWELESLHITVQTCTWQCGKPFHSAQGAFCAWYVAQTHQNLPVWSMLVVTVSLLDVYLCTGCKAPLCVLFSVVFIWIHFPRTCLNKCLPF